MMRRKGATVSVIALAAITIGIAAQPAAKEAQPESAVFVRFGSIVSYQVASAPLASENLGRIAAVLPSGGEMPSVFGDDSEGLAKSWFAAGIGERAKTGAMPLASRFRSGKCKCETQIGDDSKGRVAALYVESAFKIAEDQVVELLELRARYRDGIIIAINGREVIRRNIDSDAVAMAPARRPRGPEIESFFIAVTPGLLKTGENSLRIEVRPSGHRESPTLDFELAPRNGPRIVRGPIVNRDASGVFVSFDTDLPVAARVEWGETAALGKATDSASGALAERHVVRLPATAKATVHYKIVAGPDSSQIYSVAPRPLEGDVVRFGVYGDMRGGHTTHGKIVSALGKEAPDFVIVTGDLVLRGSDGGDWQRFFSVAKDLLATIPYYPAAGNHDMGRSGEERRLMVEQFPLPEPPADRPHWASWYSFDVADVHFVMLDSNSYRHDSQLKWLKADLKSAKARGVRAIFAATHDGPFSRGIHRGNRYAAKHYVPALAEAGVVMLFSGHDHLYQRGKQGGLNYIVSGGGGAPLYPVRCGIPGKRRCRVDDGMLKAKSEYHYLIVQVFANYARVCPKRPTRDALEKCVKIRF